MANKKIMNITSNRGEYNKSRKIYLEQKGLIHCARCPYHRGENDERKWYGTTFNFVKRVRHPNWKLVSKNCKQWMKKPVKVKKSNFKFLEDHFELFF